MFSVTRPATIEATTEAAMRFRPCVYTIAIPGKAAESHKASVEHLAAALELVTAVGYRLIDVDFPQGFAQHASESVAVEITESVFPDAYGCTETIITRDGGI